MKQKHRGRRILHLVEIEVDRCASPRPPLLSGSLVVMESKPLGNEREISPPSLDAFIPRCHLYLFRVRTADGSSRVL